MKVIKLNAELKRLRKINDEIRYRNFFAEKTFTSGVIAFRTPKGADPKQISHNDKDVVCQVLKGRGRLCAGGKRIALAPGMICHLPKGTPPRFRRWKKRARNVLFFD